MFWEHLYIFNVDKLEKKNTPNLSSMHLKSLLNLILWVSQLIKTDLNDYTYYYNFLLSF